ncbi:ATP-binding cassette domain-containing protein [Prevotella sp. E13-17]|uniref:ABC transporter ATP-binding protein n=1 Tax=Prevotella sp. E13-17 TaxID=2913616 RepID=UPI001EDAFF0E|nr:ATP-binding cassette domain-containing protein [Prevotella sp. E13-17]UKK49874.1 ATP-binding cassette domain-containing protein [Prevotella sp. E13-17]
MINISNLKKQFGKTIACDIPSFTVNDGDIVGLVGNNGAGKTTLFRMMLDLLKPNEGIITIDNVNPSVSEEWKSQTGAYIDDSFLIDYLTPDEYFAFLGKICDISSEELSSRLQQFKTFANGEIFGQNKLIRNLSAGNKQKVGIIAALVRMPNLVILDEPFNFLDPSSQSSLKHLLTEYHAKSNATILISSHNLQHTTDISTRIALMEKGHIIRNLNNDNEEAKQELIAYFEQQI